VTRMHDDHSRRRRRRLGSIVRRDEPSSMVIMGESAVGAERKRTGGEIPRCDPVRSPGGSGELGGQAVSAGIGRYRVTRAQISA